MKLSVLKRVQAERDIEEAFVFIGAASEDAGLDFLHAVEQTLETLAANPELGSQRDFLAPELAGIRMWRVKSYEKYLIFYFVRPTGIEVVRIIHSALDYGRIFSPEEQEE